MQSTTRAFLLASAAGALAALATAQGVPDTRFLGRASQVVIPQSRAFAVDRSRTPQPIVIESVSARVVVLQQTARTALDVVFVAERTVTSPGLLAARSLYIQSVATAVEPE